MNDQLHVDDSANAEQSETEESKNIDTSEDQPQKELYEVNGEQLSIEELRKGYMRQSDYTKKTQEIASKRKELTKEEQDAKNFLDEQGYMTKIDLETMKETIREDQQLSTIMDNSPDLKKHEKAIKDLYKST
jgi:hypothetical protein